MPELTILQISEYIGTVKSYIVQAPEQSMKNGLLIIVSKSANTVDEKVKMMD